MCLSNVVKNVVNCGLDRPNSLSPSASSVDGLHRGEEKHIADGVGVGQQHDQAIHAEAEAAGGGQDGLIRPSGDDFPCGARVFTFLRGCFRSAGRAVSVTLVSRDGGAGFDVLRC